MPTEITLINWTEGTVYQNDAPKRIKLRESGSSSNSDMLK